MELKGKNAVVTGSARGIGRGIALKLAKAGANIICVDLGNPSDKALTYNLAAHTDLLSTVEEVKRCGVNALPILADVTSFADCERMAAETVSNSAVSTYWSTMRGSSRWDSSRTFPKSNGIV